MRKTGNQVRREDYGRDPDPHAGVSLVQLEEHIEGRTLTVLARITLTAVLTDIDGIVNETEAQIGQGPEGMRTKMMSEEGADIIGLAHQPGARSVVQTR